MLHYLFKKIAYSFLIVCLVTVTIAAIIYLAPVDPTRLTFGQRADAATVKAKKAELGLDQPLIIQLGMYLNDLSPLAIYTHSEYNQKKYAYYKLFPIGKQAFVIKKPYFRESYQNGRAVSAILSDAIPKTALLATMAMLFATFLGVVLGVAAALHQHKWIDSLASIVAIFGYSLPSYVAAMLLALLFGFWLGDYTGLNIQGSIFELDDFGEEVIVWKNLLLPTLALGLRPVAIITLLTRATMLDVLHTDFVRTAKAKGLGYWTIILRHALRNALNPIVTAISGWFAALLTGAFFIESVFGYKGLGEVTVNALVNFDIPVVLGSVLFTATIFIAMNTLADLLYAILDPRVKLT
jgi:peptide/nickel transport system permease protein